MNSQIKIIFKCKIWEGHKFKILSEFLTNNIKSASLVVSTDGIKMCMTDQPCKTLVSLTLDSENFRFYELNSSENIILGLNLSKFNQALRCVTKKDALELYIEENDPHHLNIRILPRDGSRTTVSSIVIQDLQTIETMLPTGYSKPVVVPSANFQKMCKELTNVGSNNILVKSKGNQIEFGANADNVIKSIITLGEDEIINSNMSYESTYSTDQFTRIVKIAGLGEILKIYPGSDKIPMLFKTNIGSLGSLSVFIKSKELSELRQEKFQEYSSDDD